ncbi:AbrB/MazE/SpoVT family DNA-binding domain-containing protein [Bordetella genomosp. 12]|uniref:AbrB/MazE/SpoVT family DNA-binding domain-containing protein n=1 Tax=Bordetella genomosp. 12 TaxID=463035 RepID=UPI0011777846
MPSQKRQTYKLDSRGRVTIPKDLRNRAAWRPGDRIVFLIAKNDTLTAHLASGNSTSASPPPHTEMENL